jgi:hypothetical protein
MESIFSKIQEIINRWENSSPEAKEKFINDYSNKPEVLNKQIEHLNNIINTLKNGTEEDFAFFRENESVLNKYEDILLNQIYAEDNRSKIMLQRYFTSIDELVTNKINSADSPSQDTPQTTSEPTQAEPQPSPSLDATGMEELNKIFGELGFK